MHQVRDEARREGSPLPKIIEDRLLQKWFVENHKIADDIISCDTCQNLIGEAILAGTDPWLCPDQVRMDLKSYGLKISRRNRK